MKSKIKLFRKKNYKINTVSYVSLLSLMFLSCGGQAKIEDVYSLKDLTSPQVTSISPADAASEVTDKPVIKIVFNEKMNAATLNSSSVSLATGSGSTASGTFSYDATSNTLEFAIGDRLFTNTEYTLTLKSSIKDLAGNSLAEITSKFTTDVCPKAKTNNLSFNQSVHAIVKVGCVLYLGGNFTSVANANAYGTPLDAITGEPLSTFNYQYINNLVRAAISDGSGGWYVSGNFDKIGSKTRNGLVHLSSSGEVLDFNPGAVNGATSLLLHDGVLYMGGSFTSVGGVTRNRLAAVDANTGALLDWNPQANNDINAMVINGSILYIGGQFTCLGDCTSGTEGVDKFSRNRLAAVNTSGTVQTWNPNANSYIEDLAVNAAIIYAAGDFTDVGGSTRNRLAAIDLTGTVQAWNPNASATVSTLAIHNSIVYVGGTFTKMKTINRSKVAALDLSGNLLTWNPEASYTVASIAIMGDTIYLAGGFDEIGCAASCTQIPKQTRSSLAAVGTDGKLKPWSPNPNTVSFISASTSGGSVYVGGFFKTIAGTTRHRLAAINTAGVLQPWNPNADGIVRAMVTDNNNIYVGGEFQNVSGAAHKRLAAIDLSGTVSTTWSPQLDNEVNTLVLDGSNIYIGGNFTCIGNCPGGVENTDKFTRRYLAAINTSGAVQIFKPDPYGSRVYAISISGNIAYIGGEYSCFGNCPSGTENVDKWSRTNFAGVEKNTGAIQSWQVDASSGVLALANDGVNVYIGGYFTALDGSVRNHAGAVNLAGVLQTWHPDVGDNVNTLAIKNSNIYMGGNFTIASSQTRNYIASVNTSGVLQEWNPDLGYWVHSLLVSGSTIYAGGEHTTAGGNPSFYLTSINSDDSVNW